MRSAILKFAFLAVAGTAAGACIDGPRSPAELADRAAAVCRATVRSNRCFRAAQDLGLYTETFLRVAERLWGAVPTDLRLVRRGGVLPAEGFGETEAPSARLDLGAEYLLFLGRGPRGTWFCLHGQAGARRLRRAGDAGRSHAAEELLESLRAGGEGIAEGASGGEVPDDGYAGFPLALLPATDGISSRFTAPDRGEPIHYLLDMDALPVGISAAVAVGAVSNAFQAWSAATGIRFVSDGTVSFGQAAANVASNDYRVRLQLHDLYGYIAEADVLGKGGRAYRFNSTVLPAGGLGGRVTTNEFDLTVRGYAVLNHRSPNMSYVRTLEEVLCHEIGHVLSVDHSSDDPGEAEAVLREPIMYYTAHRDGRGAALSAWDRAMVGYVYPTNDTPPYGYDRVVDVVTPANALGVNRWELAGYDLQNAALTWTFAYVTGVNGAFALAGSTLGYEANAAFQTARFDPASEQAWDVCYLRASDGSNVSPAVRVRVLAFCRDVNGDGLPDDWAGTHWPAGGSGGANGGSDGDGLVNVREWMNASDPRDPASGLRITGYDGANLQWQARGYEWYELWHATNLAGGFTRFGNPVCVACTNATAPTPFPADAGFWQLRRCF